MAQYMTAPPTLESSIQHGEDFKFDMKMNTIRLIHSQKE